MASPALPRVLARISLRRELRYALLAATESCWVYAVLVFVAATFGGTAPSPLAIFSAYWIALVAGRRLPLMKRRWIILQGAAIGIAILTALVIVRLQVYTAYAPVDLAWLPRYLGDLVGFTERMSPALLTTLTVIYAFLRGLGFGQRPLTLWFTGFQFRLGIVLFFGTLVLSAFVRGSDITMWIFVYFSLSLLAIALARMDEMASPLPLGPRWGITLLAAVGLVIFLSVSLLQVLTLDAVDALIVLLAPLYALFGLIVILVAIPFSYLAAWLVDLLKPLFTNLGQLAEMLGNLVPPGMDEAMRQVQANGGIADVLGVLLKTLLIVAAVVGAGYLLARALNRRMQQVEDETYVREAIGNDEDAERALRERRKKQRLQKRHSGDIAAESIRRVYAALVARAAQMGLPRRTAETPYEFLPRLERAFPEPAEQVHAITEAYIAVHYGEHNAPQTEVRRVRAAWEEVKKHMKRKT